MKNKLFITIATATVFWLSMIYSSPILGQCTVVSVSPSTLNTGSVAGVAGTVAVSTQNGCTNYTVSNYISWASYTRNGLFVTISVQANTGNARNGTMLIGNKPVTIYQACGNVPSNPGTITGSNSVCPGQNNVTYSVPVISGATGYSWTLPAGASIISGSNSNAITVNFSTNASSGNITVKGTNSCGNGNVSAPYGVTVITPPAQPGLISGPTVVCSGGSYVYSITPVSGAATYSWSLPSGATGTSSTNSISITFGSSAGIVQVSAVNTQGCSSAARSLSVSLSTLSQYSVTGSGTACPDSPVSIGLLGSTSGILYKLYRDGSFLAPPVTGTGTNISFGNYYINGTYTVMAISNEGCEIPMMGSAVINGEIASIEASDITCTSSGNEICQGTSTTLTVNGGLLGTGASWKWYKDACGNNFIGSGNSITISPTTNTTYFVRAEGNCNITSCKSITVTVSTPISIQIQPEDQSICRNSTATLEVQASPNPKYIWQSSLDLGHSYNDVQGASSSQYIPSSLDENANYFYFRCKVSNSCGTTYSEPATVFVFGNLNPGQIGYDQIVNFNSIPNTLTNIVDPNGLVESFSYGWQYQSFGSEQWININNSNHEDFQPDQISTSTYFRRRVIDNLGCNTSYSNQILVEIMSDFSNNYVLIKEPRIALSDLTNANSNDQVFATKYFIDGLGKTNQIQHLGFTPSSADLIIPKEYDISGREAVTYLPFTKSNNNGNFVVTSKTDQEAYYNYVYPNDIPLRTDVFESAISNRVLESGNFGIDYQPLMSNNPGGHTTKYTYGFNAENEVLLWKVIDDSCINMYGMQKDGHWYYAPNKLIKKTIMNENWESGKLNTHEEFYDSQGKIILKRGFVELNGNIEEVNTYYCYDVLGNLRYVLTPAAIDCLGLNVVFKFNDPIVKELCYYYEYDERNRIVKKQMPGKEFDFFVYDRKDRLVLSQDGKLRKSNQWLFKKYDKLNRVVLSGILNDKIIRSQGQMQDFVDLISLSRDSYIFRDINNVQNLGYSDGSFPMNSDDNSGSLYYLNAVYYDNYIFPGFANFNSTSNISDFTNPVTPYYFNDHIRGYLSGEKVRVLGTNIFLTKTYYYDDKFRVIQTIRELYGMPDGLEIISNKYDFVGKVKQNKQKQVFNNVTTTIDRYYEYDHADRLLRIKNQVNGGTLVTIAENTYNELGQLVKKELNKNPGSYKEEIDYAYNIRGWLTKINNPESLGSDLFAMELLYDDPSKLPNTEKSPQYNGNISGIIWSRFTDEFTTKKSAYTFNYDALNRLVNNYYGEGTTLTASDKFREYDYSYDLNGNILGLKRNGGETSTMIDNLGYVYKNSGKSNQLAKVTDISGNSLGFADVTSSEDDYAYDENGNLKWDKNKGIESISYNYLNLPQQIFKDVDNSITYYYDANGTKVLQVIKIGGAVTKRYYHSGFEYTSSDLSLIQMEEGVINKETGGFTYEYFIKDHLGNTRIAFKPDGVNKTINQSTDYYPFGMTWVGSGNIGGDNKYLYNGKELQDAMIGSKNLDWYDYGARMYDPQIGRFHTIDPMAEDVYGINPYNYCFNNPILFIDPTGMWGESSNNAWTSTFVDPTGKVIEHRDDGDPTVYLVLNQDEWEKGGKKKDGLHIVGWEDWRKDYKEGDQYTYYNPTEDPEYDGQYMIPSDAYDYSQDVIDGKMAEDWAYYIYGGPWYEAGKRWRQIMWRDISSSRNRGTVLEAGVDIAFVGGGGKATGWISKKVFRSLPPSLQKKFVSAIGKGVVAPTGQQGIVKLSASEIAEKGLAGYTHKLKILGQGGDLRIYGRMGDNGHIVFDKIMGH